MAAATRHRQGENARMAETNGVGSAETGCNRRAGKAKLIQEELHTDPWGNRYGVPNAFLAGARPTWDIGSQDGAVRQGIKRQQDTRVGYMPSRE